MKRRAFLQKSSMLVSGAALAGVAGLYAQPAWAEGAPSGGFALDVITDQPERAIRHIERLIQASSFRRQHIQFAECQLSGSHVGDIALVRFQRLIDYRKAEDAFSRHLTEIARSLSLPRRHDNPMLLRFYSENQGSAPQYVNVFCGEILLHQWPVGENKEALRVEGARGYVDLSVQDRSVRIVDASCKHKTCMKLGAISQPGQTLVCIPAQISVALEGRNNLGVDSVTF